MPDIEKIRQSLEMLDNISAAALYDGEIICKTTRFAEDEKAIGKSHLDYMILTGKPYFSAEYVYYADVSEAEDYSVAVITKRTATAFEIDSYQYVADLSVKIRSSAMGISSALDSIYKKGCAYGCMPESIISQIEIVDRRIASLYGKAVMIDDISMYKTNEEMFTLSADLYGLLKDIMRDLAAIIMKNAVRIIVAGTENSCAVIRLDTLRIIVSSVVREIMLMPYKPEYIEVNVFHNNTEAGFTITGGTLEGKKTSIKSFSSPSDDLIPYNILTDVLSEAFCKSLGGRYYKLKDDCLYHMGITLPADLNGEKTEKEIKFEYKNSLYNAGARFSYENSILSDAAKKKRYNP